MITLNLDNKFMSIALKYAKVAYDKDEVPIGAVLVSSDSKILSRGYNMSESKHSQSYHAEVIAINKAGKRLNDWRLIGCTLYVTVEPCLMCVGLIGLSRIERLVYGAPSPFFGHCLDKLSTPDLYKKHIKEITKGVMENEAKLLLKKFFLTKRKKGE